jgi:heme A synthase
MVRSGLSQPKGHEVPRVSPYRLAGHLTCAFTIYATLLWTTLTLAFPQAIAGTASTATQRALGLLRSRLVPVSALIAITAVSGTYEPSLLMLQGRLWASLCQEREREREREREKQSLIAMDVADQEGLECAHSLSMILLLQLLEWCLAAECTTLQFVFCRGLCCGARCRACVQHISPHGWAADPIRVFQPSHSRLLQRL